MPKSKAALCAFTEKQIARFKASYTVSGDCWLWRGPCVKRDPAFGVFNFGDSHLSAHRAAWVIAHGEIAGGFDIFRTCGNSLCVRTDHLRLGVTGSSPLSRQQRFDRMTRRDASTGCIVFTGSTDLFGYGKFERTVAHRVAWEIHHGPIPKGMFVCHKCDNPPCVNLEHLFLGTQADNVADMVAKNRHYKDGAPLGHIGAGRKFSDEQIDLIRIAYSSGQVNMNQIALVHGVDKSVISRIINGVRYRAARA